MAFFGDDLNFDIGGGEDLEDGSDDSASYEYGGTEARVFLVDAHRRMFEKAPRHDEDDGAEESSSSRSPFVDVINAILISIRRRVFTSNTSLYAVVLYGTKEKKNSYDFNGVYVLQDLNLIDPQRIHTLEEMIEFADQRFSDDLGHSTAEVSLCDALQTASILFKQSSTRLGEKRVFLFTNEDDPCRIDATAKRAAMLRAADLKELHHEITLIPLLPSGQDENRSFDPKPFFKELLQLGDEEAEELRQRVTNSWEELEARLKGLEDKRRRLASLDFQLGKIDGEPVSLSVGLYSMVREKTAPKFVYRWSKDNKTEVKTVTKKFVGGEDGSGDILLPSDIKKGIAYGGRNLLFEEDELRKMKDFGSGSDSGSGIQLLGFKPLSRLRRHHHIGPSSFLYPDEASTEGSTRLFVALLRRCSERRKMALVRIVPRQHSAPIMAALIPQEEERGEDGLQILPGGFWVKPLPFSDDCRDLSSVIPLDSEQNKQDIEETKDITDKIVKKLTFKFDPRNFENPALRTHYNVIESLALGREAQPVEDSTKPPIERIDKKIGGLCSDWKEISWPPGYDPEKSSSGSKRPAATATAPAKKVKAESGEGGGDTDVQAAAQEGRLGKLTVAELKAFCKEKAISVKSSAKKAELIDAINEHLGVG